MSATMIHADGTDCHHHGPAQRMADDEGGPACAAGIEVTHVRIGDNTMSISDVFAAIQSMAAAFVNALSPLVTAMAEALRKLSEDPRIRAVAAAAAVVDEERAKELGSGG